MKRNIRLFLGLLLVFSLAFLPLSGPAKAEDFSCLKVKNGCNTLKGGTSLSLADQLYAQIHEQIEQQLGSRYHESTLAKITNNLVQELLPRLEKIFASKGKPQLEPSAPQPEPQPRPPVPQPDPQPVPEPIRPPEEKEIGAAEPSWELTPDEALMLELVNQERTRLGLRPLDVDRELTRLARLKAQDMIACGYFSHLSPTYGSPFQMMREAGLKYSYAGENLAGSPTVKGAHLALMDSPGHRANILNSNFTRAGIGIAAGGNYGKILVQMFIKPL